MTAGGKCKYLLYVASVEALANCQRHAVNFVHVLCLSKEGDQLSMRLISDPQTKQVQGALQQSYMARRARWNGTSWLPSLQKPSLKPGFKPK